MIEFTPALLDDIRSRVLVSDVVGRHVKLTKRGREWVGLSPFNQEKTPSFTVNDAKGFYHCFSSGKHGDQFRFLMEVEGLNFPEAVEKLAREAGVTLPKKSYDPKDDKADALRKATYEALEAAAAFYETTLNESQGSLARNYLTSRNIDAETMKTFRLGVSPTSRNALRGYLEGKGFGLDAMINAGLLIHGDDIPVPYDRFRNRLMIPIRDTRDRVIAFGARALSADAQAKYLNSPETPLFHKGSTLYFGPQGLSKARAARKLFLVEGYLDVIAMHKAGIPEVAAPLGTALTERQMGMIWKISDEPVLCFDGDKAGLKAAFRSVETALSLITTGKSIEWVLLPQGCDPDDLLKTEGVKGLTEALSLRVNLSNMIWQKSAEGKTLTSPEGRASFEKALFSSLETMTDSTLQRHMKRHLNEMVENAFFAPHTGRNTFRQNKRYPKSYGSALGQATVRPSSALSRTALAQSLKGRQSVVKGEARDAAILRTLINHPPLISKLANELEHLAFHYKLYDDLLRYLFGLGRETHNITADMLIQDLYEAGLGSNVEAILHHPLASTQWPSSKEAAVEDALTFINAEMALHRRTNFLNRELHESAELLAHEDDPSHYQRLSALAKQSQSLEGSEPEIDGFGIASGRTKPKKN